MRRRSYERPAAQDRGSPTQGAGRAGGLGAVLRVQRMAGNRAVKRLVQRNGPLIDLERGWTDEQGRPTTTGQRNQPTLTNEQIQEQQREGLPFELSEEFLSRLGFTKRAGNQWQRDFNQRRDHISMRHSRSRLVGDDPRRASYRYTFSSFHVTFVTKRGNIQFHWVHLGQGVWKQAGHTRSELIRQWGEDPDELDRLAKRVADDFIHDDLRDIDTIDVEKRRSLI